MVRPTTTSAFVEKANKEDVHYRRSENCRSCDYYRNGTCAIIAGGIDPSYICDKWVINANPKNKEGIFAEYYIDEYKKVQKK